MDRDLLKRLLSKREHTKLDFKASLDLETENGKRELAKDVIAIANTDGGRGYLLVGVTDDRRVIGVDPDLYPEERIQQIVGYRSDPPVAIRLDRVSHGGKMVLVITIFKSLFRPHQYRQSGAFYIRRGSTTDFARRDEIGSMLKTSMLLSDDLYPVRWLGPEVLDEDLLAAYARSLGLGQLGERRLAYLGMLAQDPEEGGMHPTVGAIISLTLRPDLYIPSYKTRILDRRDFSRSVQITGPIHRQYQETLDYLDRHLSGFEPVRWAIAEALSNALLHRDYLDNHRSVVVELFEDRVIIKNPGALPGHTRLSQVMGRRFMIHRNPWLYRTVLLIGGGILSEEGDHLRRIKNLPAPYAATFSDHKASQTFEVLIERRNSHEG